MEMQKNINREESGRLLEFIRKSPSVFHAVSTLSAMLDQQGFAALKEGEEWTLEAGRGYYVTRNSSSVIAFRLPDEAPRGFAMAASHGDSPSLKLKVNPVMDALGHYTKLNVETYGGMIMPTWMDRPLSAAGRLLVKDGEGIRQVLVNVDRDMLVIPSVAIHMNRNANSGMNYNAQTDMLPLYANQKGKESFFGEIARAAGVEAGDILAHDLYLYNRDPGRIWGADEEFLSAPRLDDLQCAFATMSGLLSARAAADMVQVCCVFDNEECGSSTRQGAGSTLLNDTLERICDCLGLSHAAYLRLLANSFMISADNAHAVHPNHSEYADPVNRPWMNEGIVVKYSAAQKYTTDGLSDALFRRICQMAEVKTQSFTNRSDMGGGSTLGNISSTRVSVSSVDIGLPQLAMHSAMETAGTGDTADLIRACRVFYERYSELI